MIGICERTSSCLYPAIRFSGGVDGGMTEDAYLALIASAGQEEKVRTSDYESDTYITYTQSGAGDFYENVIELHFDKETKTCVGLEFIV